MKNLEECLEILNKEGILVLDNFLPESTIQNMQQAINVKFKTMRWNDVDGYEKTEKYRHFVFDLLTLEQGFVDAALQPDLQALAKSFLGDQYTLVEARACRSLPVNSEFHGWHSSAWYDRDILADDDEIPKELKLVVYLSDVKNGGFQYLKGTHRQYHPNGIVDESDLFKYPNLGKCHITGKAGTAILYDSSGLHNMEHIPVIDPRIAVFMNYRDPSIKVQEEDIKYYRYHPLILNAAFLGGLTQEDKRILGFGDHSNYIPNYERPEKFGIFQSAVSKSYDTLMLTNNISSRVIDKVKKHIDI